MKHFLGAEEWLDKECTFAPRFTIIFGYHHDSDDFSRILNLCTCTQMITHANQLRWTTNYVLQGQNSIQSFRKSVIAKEMLL